MSAGEILRVDDIDVFYGASQILFGVSFGVEKGQSLALLADASILIGLRKSLGLRRLTAPSPLSASLVLALALVLSPAPTASLSR